MQGGNSKRTFCYYDPVVGGPGYVYTSNEELPKKEILEGF